MATIAISDLYPAGSNLFIDNESYLHELSESDFVLNKIQGGTSPFCVLYVATAIASGCVGFALTQIHN
ncbi:MAG: hypothetical protein MUD14_00290 [Hydrococcus sp. Prado102]|jgi:hypothetical protein|nr:hypothetical protein [Hydrococcus sp. Prado102]